MASPSEVKKWVIYKIANPVGQIYIGCSSNYKRRLQRYKYKETESQPLIHASISVYGYDNHIIEIIDEFMADKQFAEGKEIFWIRTYMSNNSKWPEIGGLNRCDGGQGTFGLLKTEHEKRQSSLRNKGYKHTEANKLKIGEASKGNKHNLGRKHSPEIIEKRRVAFIKTKGRPINQYDKNGVFIKSYDCIRDASNELNISYQRIGDCCRNKLKNMNLVAFIFKYK